MQRAGGTPSGDPFLGRVAVVTGGAAGLGLAMAPAFAARGASLVLADIDAAALAQAERELAAAGAEVLGVPADVTRRESVVALADAAFARFGAVHLLCNNAGIALLGPLVGADTGDWRKAMDVNFWGVVHGIDAFLPRMIEQRQGGHVVNTASIGGLQMRPGWNTGAYSMTKYAVVALSEALEQELAGSGIGVSVLCPASVRTAIYDSAKNRPARLGGPFRREQQHFLKDTIADGLTPLQVGERVLRAIRDDEFFVFTHSEPRQLIEARHRRIMEAFDRIAEIEHEERTC